MLGGADDREVHVHRLAVERRDGTLLQDAEQPRLQVQRHVPDLIQKNRATVGLLDLADRCLVLGAESALLVAEKLRLERSLRNGGAIQRHELAASAQAAVVDCARQPLFADAGFALDQDRNVAAERAPRLFDVEQRHRIGCTERIERQVAQRTLAVERHLPFLVRGRHGRTVTSFRDLSGLRQLQIHRHAVVAQAHLYHRRRDRSEFAQHLLE